MRAPPARLSLSAIRAPGPNMSGSYRRRRTSWSSEARPTMSSNWSAVSSTRPQQIHRRDGDLAPCGGVCRRHAARAPRLLPPLQQSPSPPPAPDLRFALPVRGDFAFQRQGVIPPRRCCSSIRSSTDGSSLTSLPGHIQPSQPLPVQYLAHGHLLADRVEYNYYQYDAPGRQLLNPGGHSSSTARRRAGWAESAGKGSVAMRKLFTRTRDCGFTLAWAVSLPVQSAARLKALRGRARHDEDPARWLPAQARRHRAAHADRLHLPHALSPPRHSCGILSARANASTSQGRHRQVDPQHPSAGRRERRQVALGLRTVQVSQGPGLRHREVGMIARGHEHEDAGVRVRPCAAARSSAGSAAPARA